ncbi:uncharacterized protein LOC107370194 isoform X2 [Tetranychus urticae]|uniref:uncharacterized protein LOC107370194 isoform X2 n=1 Tax=Tetranychus urticae TaxID=32264 RepID=UPI00077C0A0B|nr:uncharacterized protein LOC107370194 isoform X2 [Tetranychus urticae]
MDEYKQSKLNLTVAAFEIPISSLFHFEGGQYVAVLKPLRTLIDDIAFYGFFDIYVKVSSTGQVGRLTESGYQDGILGMLQNREVDSLFIPIPIDTPKAPGWFTPIIREEAFYIYSIPYTSTRLSQEIGKNLLSFNLMLIWLAIIVSTFVLEIAIHVISQTGIATLLLETLSRYIAVLFNQYIPRQIDLIRLVQNLLLVLSMSLFSASFSTSTIIGDVQGKIDILGDVVQQNKIPIFFEGLSVFELFQTEASKDYRDVYRQSVRKGSNQPFGLTSTDVFELLSPDYAILCSEQAGKSGSIIPAALGNAYAAKIYKSKGPYHQSLLAYIVNPLENAEEIKRRLSNLALRSLQGGVLSKALNDVLEQFILSISFLSIEHFDIVKWKLGTQIEDKVFDSLKFSGIKILFQVHGYLLLLACIVHLIEHLSSLINPSKFKRELTDNSNS